MNDRNHSDRMAQDCCRLCSESSGALISIFGDQGISRKISEKINLRLHILVHTDDFLPKTICFSCCGKLDIFDSFVKNVHSVQGHLIKQVSTIPKNSTITHQSNVIDTIEVDTVEIIHDEPRSSKISENTTAKKRVLNKVESCVIKKAKTNQDNQPISRIALHINDACSLPNSSSVNTCNRPLTRKNGSNSTETIDLQHETVNDSRKKLNSSAVSSHTKNEPNRSETTRNFAVKPMKITDSVRKSESAKNETPNRKQTKFKRKYFELKPKNQLVAKTPVKRLPPVTSKIKSSPNKKRSPRQIRSPKKSVPSATKKDYSAQAGNTLYSDLRNLKNSLILKKVPVESAEVLAIFTKPDIPSKIFSNSRTDKGCQTDVRLVSRSKGKDAVIHPKLPALDGKSPLDNYWEKISSPFDI